MNVSAGPTLVRGGLLIDGTGTPPIPRGVVLIEDGRIAAVGTEESMGSISGAQLVDCSDQVLIPGLIDCHNHMSMDPKLYHYGARMQDSDGELALRASAMMALDLRAGVTTTRCLGDRNFLDATYRKAVEAGWVAGPRLVIATRGIRATHGHGFVGYPFDGVEAVRRAVRENLRAGADLIKLFATGTVRGERGIPCYLSQEEISTAVQEARSVGVPTAVHCIGGPALERCVRAGIDAIEHGYFATDADLDLMVRSDSWLVLTLSPYFMEERIRNMPPDLADAFRVQQEEVAGRMSAAIESGVRYAVGTDAMHGQLARELEYLVELGASRADALASVTARAAELCGLREKLGTIEPGKVADLVGVRGNPLEDIRAVGRVATVIQNGRVVHSERVLG